MHEADFLIEKLGLIEHVEGGYFKEIYRSPYELKGGILNIQDEETRNSSSSIFYLLKWGQVSSFHSLKFDELWYFHCGSPLLIHTLGEKGLESCRLGMDIENGELPAINVPSGSVFAAEVAQANSFSLVSCVVSPGFDYRDFKMYSAGELIEMFPQHEILIRKFNK